MRLPRLSALLPAVATVLAMTATVPPATAANPVTPGNITGYGFDQCVAPEQWKMDRWMERSPFLAVGIYISGRSRGCRTQPNLTPTWVSTQLRKGWRLLPITLGPQASCHPGFPRYGDDPTISPNPDSNYARARSQGRGEATTAVRAASSLGIVKGSTLWYDLEGFNISNTRCRESALRFLSAWTTRVRDLGYVSGVYSSAASGIKMLDDARVNRPKAFALPDRIWIARWDGRANTSTSYIRSDGWRPGGRMKQYRGGHNETWGGVTINIDSNWLDLGRGSVAARESHCGGIQVNKRTYPRLSRYNDVSYPNHVKALKCLLKEKGFFDGRTINGTYGPALDRAVRSWQTRYDYQRTSDWRPRNWQRLTAQGGWQTLKTGSAGRYVRKAQRSLNSMGHNLVVSGVYNAATRDAVRAYQRSTGMTVTGIAGTQVWDGLRRGVR